MKKLVRRYAEGQRQNIPWYVGFIYWKMAIYYI